jgi:hypothetical protein
MKYWTLFSAQVLVLLCGCTFSRGFAYYKPSGAGKIALDERQIPTSIAYGFGTGSVLTVSTKRRRAEVEILFTVRLRDSARYENRSAGIVFSCNGGNHALPAPVWHEQRIRDGDAYQVDHAWGDGLEPGNAPVLASKPAHGDHSTGEYRASMILRECKDVAFDLAVPAATVGSTTHQFGRPSFVPKMMPLTWALPVPARVGDVK